jgi:hypothetical protein
MTDDRHIPQEDLALHAMQALSSEESATVRLHLCECEACRAELARIEGDLSLVAMSVEQHLLPEGARERFSERIGATSANAEQLLNGGPIAIDSRKRPARSTAWMAWMATAALLVLAIGMGLQIHILNRKLAEASQLAAARAAEDNQAREVLDVLQAPKAQRVLLTAEKTPPAPSARAVYVPSRGALILEASNLKPLPDDKTYELWVIPASGAAPIPAGLFRPDTSGSASLLLPKIPQGIPAKAFGVTIENASGATKPTAPIILSGAAPTISD